MKKFGFLLTLLLAATMAASAQTPAHTVTLTWTPPADATSSSTITVFRTNGACTPTPTFTSMAAGQPMNAPFVDTTVTVGTYCYTIQHVLNGANSANSNLAPVTVSPLPPTGLTVVVK